MIGTAASVSLFLICWFAVKVWRIGRREVGLPPGPSILPLLGNALEFPKCPAQYKFTEWAREYGDIYSLKVGPGTVIVLSSATAIKELMDKRSAGTSDRPPSHMVQKITGGFYMATAGYSDYWRAIRKAANNILTVNAAARHIPIQQAETAQLMHDLLKDPEQFPAHLRRHACSSILSVLYGKRCPRFESREAVLFFRMMSLWERVVLPGAHPPVDLIPILKYVPEKWASWKTECRQIRKLQRELYFGLLKECEERLDKGYEIGCFMEEVVRRKAEFGLNQEMMGYLGGVLFDGGSDTTGAFFHSLILALVAFPDAQRKAHEELDSVVGSQRSPTIGDFSNLPYIQATHRFRPATPLSVPHAASRDEEYRGYLVPKGSTIITNFWGIYHDPDIFEKPEIFNPDRYLHSEFGTKPGVDDRDFRHTFIFGSGRRICPGIHFANQALMITTMNLLWAFRFSPAVDPVTKQPIAVDIYDYHDGIVTAPNPFKCSIVPRSTHHRELIERNFSDALPTFIPYEEHLDEEDMVWISQNRGQAIRDATAKDGSF